MNHVKAAAVLLTAGSLLAHAPCHAADLNAAAEPTNPLLGSSGLPYDAPPFDRIRDSDYRPAIEATIADHDTLIRRIADDPAPPSFDNTIVAMERAGGMLTRISQIFENMTQANTDDTLEAAQKVIDPELQAHQDDVHMNQRLFTRIRTLYEARDTLPLDAKSRFLLEQTYKDFVHSGAALDDADKVKLRELNRKITKLTTDFKQKLRAASAAGAIGVDDKASLDGLADDEIEAAEVSAQLQKKSEKFLLSLKNTTQQPLLARLKDRDLRARILAASETRGDADGPNDLRDLVATVAQLRAQKAKLLGFDNFAAYTLANQMAKSPEKAMQLMDQMVPASTANARQEMAYMQTLIVEEGGSFRLTAYDWPFYAEQMGRRKYDLDDAVTRPYFELDRVLHDGVFFAANRLYGLTFKERHDIPVFQRDVRTFEVFDYDGTPTALLYVDYFARPNKQGGAWCDDLVPPSGLLDRNPVVVNVANFTKPAPGKPALLSFDDVTTMFHEFGHALHTIFSNQRFPSQNGFSTPTDWIEFPSQFNEHWALDPAVLASYARHYETGQAMPSELATKLLQRAKTFNQGYKLTEYLAAALLDMEWHILPADTSKQATDAFEVGALTKHRINLPEVPPRYRTTYFSHIWGSGYAANYYAYLWSEVLADDAFAWFEENGGLTRQNGQRFRDMLLAPGFTADPGDLYRTFRGRDPSVEPLLREKGMAR